MIVLAVTIYNMIGLFTRLSNLRAMMMEDRLKLTPIPRVLQTRMHEPSVLYDVRKLARLLTYA